MKVSEVIAMLKENHKPDEDIFVAYWAKELFESYCEDGSLTDEVWSDVVADMDRHDLNDHTNESAYEDIALVIDKHIKLHEKGNK